MKIDFSIKYIMCIVNYCILYNICLTRIYYVFNVAGCNGISFLAFIDIRFNFSDPYFY